MIASFVRNADDEHMIQMNPLHEQIRRHAHVDDDAFQVSRRVLHNHWLNICGNGSLRDLLSTWKMRMSVGRLVRMRAEDIERSLRDNRSEEHTSELQSLMRTS